MSVHNRSQNLSLTQLSESLWPTCLHRTSHWHSFLDHCDLQASTEPLTDTAFWITVTYMPPQNLSLTQLSESLWPTCLHKTSHWHSFLDHCDLHASTEPLTDTAFWITVTYRPSQNLTDTAFWITVTYRPSENLSLTQLSGSLWPTCLHRTSHWHSFLNYCDLHASTEPLTDTAFWITVTYMSPQNLSLTQLSESLWPTCLHRTSHWHSFLNHCDLHASTEPLTDSFLIHCDLYASTEPFTDTAFWIIVTYMPPQNLSLTQLSESLWPICLHRTSHWHSFLNHCDLHASTKPLTDTAFWIIVTYMPPQNLALTQLSESLWPTCLHRTSHWHSFLNHCDLHASTEPLTDTAFWIIVTYMPPQNLSLTQLSESLWPTCLHRTSHWHSFLNHCDLYVSTEPLTDTAFWIIVTYMPPQNLSLTQLSESLWPTCLHRTSHWHSFLNHCDLHASTEPRTDTAFWIIVTYMPPQNLSLTQLSGSLWPTCLHRTSHWHSFLNHCDLHASTEPHTDTAFWIIVTYMPPQNLALTQLSESLWPTCLHKTSHWHSFLDHCDLHASTEPLTDTAFWIIVTYMPPQNLSLTQLSGSLWPTCLHRTSHWHSFLNHCDLQAFTKPLTDTAFWIIVTYMPPQNPSLTQLSGSLWPTCLHKTSHWHSFLDHCDLHVSTKPLTDTAFWITVTYMSPQNLSLTQLSGSLWPTSLHKTSHWHSFLDHCDLQASTEPLTDTAFWIIVTYRPPQNFLLTQLSGSLWPTDLHKTSHWQLSGSLWPTGLHITSYWHSFLDHCDLQTSTKPLTDSFLDHCDLQVPSPCHGMDHVWKHPVWSVSFSSDSNKCVSCIAGW